MGKILILTNHSYMLYRFRTELIRELMKDHEVVLSMPFVGHEEDFMAMGLKCIETEVDRRGINPKRDLKLLNFYRKLLKAEKPSIFFEVLREMDQLDHWFPELKALIGLEQNPVYHAEGDVWNHTMMVLDQAAKLRHRDANPYWFMLAALCHDFGKAVCGHVIDRVALCIGAGKPCVGHKQNGDGCAGQQPFDDRGQLARAERAVCTNGICPHALKHGDHCLGVGTRHELAIRTVYVGNEYGQAAVFLGRQQCGLGFGAIVHGFNQHRTRLHGFRVKVV